MASSDARPVPRKNVAYRVTFPILDADGDLVTGAASLDSEVSIDGATFSDCTNEATEIATSSGIYYLDLTQSEMNGDTVAVIVKTGTAGAKTTTIVMYPEEAGDYRADVTHFGGSAGTFSSGRPEVNTTHAAGTAWGSGAITAASIASDAITAAKIANGAIDAATFAADVDAEILSYIVDDATRIDASALNTATVTTIPAILVDTGTTLDGKIDTIDTNVDSILADTGTDGVVVAAGSKTGYALTSGERTSIADALLDRDMSTGADNGSATVRTVRQALRILRNKWGIAGGTLTVTKEDDTTTSWTAAVTQTAGDPVSEVDPASS